MNKYLLSIVFAFCSSIVDASGLIPDDSVKHQSDCFSDKFSSYESWRGFIEQKNKAQGKSEKLIDKAMQSFDKRFSKTDFDFYRNELICSSFIYQVDGVDVFGYVIKPRNHNGKLPVLIYNRGGNGNFGSVVFASMMHNLFPIANEGFVIIGSQYRGTFSEQDNADEFGGKDVDDVVALRDFIGQIPGADPQRVGMFGASRGGMQTFLALKRMEEVKAIATIAGVSDLSREIAHRPEMERVFKHRIPDYQHNKKAELEKRSTLNNLDDLSASVPILLLHGTDDERVQVEQSTLLAEALSRKQLPHKLVLYPGDNHFLSNNKEKANKEIVDWFKRYL
ncbi:alpha/beta hydrolase family protein [Bowmanella denitrificans]|uniref:alpha/beta hydrolase family protein n=1 Tax=Bowmanella denitrificans TaxID=366582 RepID=UPI000C9A3831|nr:prolyl oligopeptidase family serine peptidase [Bowmanella denitrificans]